MDVSQYQPLIDWPTVAGSGIGFCFLRVSHGLHLDTVFARHRQGAKSVRMPRGFYHYFVPTQSVDDQVKLFVSAVGRIERGDLPPVLDLEDPPAWATISRAKRLGLVIRWLNAVEQALGVRPLIYCSLNFIRDTLEDPSVDVSILGTYPLWIARWRVPPGQPPQIPSIWRDWAFWQYSDNTTVPGINGPVDGDVYHGTLGSLRNLKRRKPPAPRLKNKAPARTRRSRRGNDKRR
jgi:lysozyme